MILTFIEHDRGKLNESSLEALTLARRLADDMASRLEVALIGAEARALAEPLAAYGAVRAHLVEHAWLDDYAPDAWAASLAQLMAATSPDVVVAAGSERGNEVMARLAARLDLPLASNCTEVATGQPFRVTRVRWGGSLLEEAHLKGSPALLTVAEHALAAESISKPPEIDVRPFVPTLTEEDMRVRVVRRVEPEREGVSLTDARVVVAGGRGVGSAEGFAALEELAGLLGGAVAASRVATNNGWRPHADQVGQTGARVAPDLYIACGISGAIQHWVGCKAAKHILAINTDPEAPMVTKADYAIIGDLHEVLPAIIQKLKS
ncbi:MAG: electron transfer flavoprotein subunit alpha/FixB family protein [Chloroflexi bacterium]|nr:electron transfer flavoprotein subunit alpha/FixB family protein [Chloroflexota bacterium]